MGGIAGIFNFDGRPVAVSDLRRMTAASGRLAPDGEDFWVHSSFGLGCRHARITPESLAEKQPVVSPSHTAICFDGRLDNRDEIARLLPSAPGVGGARSDALLALAAYEQLGDRVVARLNGDFALALCDCGRQELLLARDVMAARCLYYCSLSGTLLFGTDIKCLLADSRVRASPDEDGLADLILDRWCDRHRTCFTGIHSVPPGHLLIANRDRVQIREHWAFDPGREIRYGSFADYRDAFRSLFEQSVRRRLRSAHPVAVSVSGGVDSSSIFCQAASLVRRDALPTALHGIAMTFPAGTAADEQRFLDEIENACGARISRVPVSELRHLENADALVGHLEMPGVLWQAQGQVLERARHHGCRTILSGFFGDQMLAERGYLVDLARRGRWLKVRHDLAEFAAWMSDVDAGFFAREFRSRAMRALAPRRPFLIAKRYLGRWRAKKRYAPWFTPVFRDRVLRHQLDRLAASPRFARSHTEAYFRHATAGHYVALVQRELRAGLMHGVEVSYPFRDRDLVAFLMAIPGEVVSYGGIPKGLLRAALKGVVPDAVLARRTKADFTAVGNQAAVRDHPSIVRLMDRDCLSVRAGFVDGPVLEASLGTFAKKIAADEGVLSGWQLTDLAGLELWLRKFFGDSTAGARTRRHALGGRLTDDAVELA